GQKSEVIQLQQVDGNIAEKNIRQIFAKVPGVFAYDMDGSGNQVNIATRGLDPHRGWEYNIRTNGVLTNSDMYGYPASHFSVPMEAVERVELIRGNASLQYGSQFGGMLNYIVKSVDTSKTIGYETMNTVGSFGLQSTYHRIGGRTGKLTYQAYYHRRVSDGYRKNSRSLSEGEFVSLTYAFKPTMTLRAELGRSFYRYQIPGPLTDAQFAQDPRQATRSRNYFSPDIYIPSLRFDWQISPRTTVQATLSAVLGSRNSVTFEGFATVPDTISRVTGQYKNRQVDIDQFHSYTLETRVLHRYELGSIASVFSGGIQLMKNDLHRRQLGVGTTGTDYDLTRVSDFTRDMHLRTNNVAFFAENLFQLTQRLSIVPGIRVESGVTKSTGRLAYYDPASVPNQFEHHYPLFSVNGQYRLSETESIYGGWAQAYRPVVYKDILPGNALEKANPNTKDARGYNAEVGVRGKKFEGRLSYDITAFQLLIRNRLGSQVITEDGQNYVYKTNIGDSRTRGVEAYLEYAFVQTHWGRVSIFTSTAYMDGRYLNGMVTDGSENQDITGNKIESVPEWTTRNGLQMSLRGFTATLQYSFVAKTFADPLNTVQPTANGAKGIVPSYGLWDLYAGYRLGRRFTVKGGISNIANKSYFTKRPTMYPGPGVWPSDGRSAQLSVGLTL
ncbi:MAG: TonB-dependent receptor, partial [Siphonobacter sp.]